MWTVTLFTVLFCIKPLSADQQEKVCECDIDENFNAWSIHGWAHLIDHQITDPWDPNLDSRHKYTLCMFPGQGSYCSLQKKKKMYEMAVHFQRFKD